MQDADGTAFTCQANQADESYLQAVREGRTGATDAVDLLSSQYFFTSPKLAALATEAEVLAEVVRLSTSSLHLSSSLAVQCSRCSLA